MKYRLEITKSAQKKLNKLEGRTRTRLITAIGVIIADPHVGKPLEGKFKGLRSYRVGIYRILYEIFNNILVVVIVDVGHRRDVHK